VENKAGRKSRNDFFDGNQDSSIHLVLGRRHEKQVQAHHLL
jgi:hypothetical protein